MVEKVNFTDILTKRREHIITKTLISLMNPIDKDIFWDIDQIKKKNEGDFILDLEVKINGVEVSFIQFFTRILEHYDKDVKDQSLKTLEGMHGENKEDNDNQKAP